MKKTTLFPLHENANAKMGPFAGFEMPLFYPLGMVKEHIHTRTKAGLFDISHMVHISVEGVEAASFLEKICPCLASEQSINTCRYSFFLNDNGGVIDDLMITRLGQNQYRVVVNAGCADKDWAHMLKISADFDVTIEKLELAFIALQGPDSESVLKNCGHDFSDMVFMTAKVLKPDWFITRSGYTGEDGFEIAASENEIFELSQQLLNDKRVALIGLGARDSLRLEAGLSLYSQDLTDDISPAEAGQLWAIPKKLRSNGEYLGSKALIKQLNGVIPRKRIGLKIVGKLPVRSHTELFNNQNESIGEVTSGGIGSTCDSAIAMALVAKDFNDSSCWALVRNKRIEMNVHTLPFVAHTYKR